MSYYAGIVTYNSNLDNLKESLQTVTKQFDTVIIQDNGSQNIEAIKTLAANYQNVIVAANAENLGFVRALNQIMEFAEQDGVEWVLLLNSIMAMLARHTIEKGCIFHSDRGSQYTSKAVMELLKQYGLRQSFSRVGMPGDNAWSESFFATMKKELIHWTHFTTKESVRSAVFEYIYCFYNVKRIQKRLGYMSPREYLRSLRTERSEEAA